MVMSAEDICCLAGLCFLSLTIGAGDSSPLQEGEDPALAKPVTENLNAVLQLLQYSAVRRGGGQDGCAA